MQEGTGYLLDLMALPGAAMREKDQRGVPSNPQELLKPGSDSFVYAVHMYRQLLARMVIDTEGRKRMSGAAVAYAKTRTWEEAMGCLLEGDLPIWRLAYLRASKLARANDIVFTRISTCCSCHSSEAVDTALSHTFSQLEHSQLDGH